MKRIIAAILLVLSAGVFASDIYVQKNSLGEEIVLTDQVCPFPDAERFAFAYIQFEELRIIGCWFLFQSVVHILWQAPGGPEHREYNPADFILQKII